MPVRDVKKYLRAIEIACPELLPREALAFFFGCDPRNFPAWTGGTCPLTTRL